MVDAIRQVHRRGYHYRSLTASVSDRIWANISPYSRDEARECEPPVSRTSLLSLCGVSRRFEVNASKASHTAEYLRNV